MGRLKKKKLTKEFCNYCGGRITAPRSNKKYCCPSCRVLDCFERQKVLNYHKKKQVNVASEIKG